jgi:hypothetical protein
MAAVDRLETLLAQNQVTGIDFVEVSTSQIVLDVYFLRDPAAVVPSLVNNITADQIRIWSPSGGERLATATVTGVSWPASTRRFMRVTVAAPGDFSLYTLRIEDPRIDRYYNDYSFTFKVNCESDLDCTPSPHECCADPVIEEAPDYLARDFWSFRGALLDFASRRFPAWKDRLEADAGVMLAEAMSALGDELAYYQDRVAREAHFETASQRRSLRRHARLVDHELHDGTCATAWLEIVASGPALTVPAGTVVEARDDAGRVTPFQIGTGLTEMVATPVRTFAVDSGRNSIPAHVWDEDDTCLPCGATEVYLAGTRSAILPLDDTPPGQPAGRWVFLRATSTIAGLPERRHRVRLIEVTDREPDGVTLMRDTVQNVPITRVRWEAEQALPFEMELTTLTLRGNVVPAVAGTMRTQDFTIGVVANSSDPVAVEREGANGSIAYLFSLPDPDGLDLCRRGENPYAAIPDVRLDQVVGNALREWTWRRSLIGDFATLSGATASLPSDTHFTLDDGTWSAVAAFDRVGETLTHVDYKRGAGTTTRFGDGVFGRMPAPASRFRARYRVGNGARFNLGADALKYCTHPAITGITNPLPTSGGLAPETPAEARQLAPEGFRARTYRAVRPEDYAEAAERVEWVQRAGATFRWTGSWLTAFVTPDPLNAFTLTRERRNELELWLDRFRQAGRETHAIDPVYANLDLEVVARVEDSAYPGEVRAAVMRALFGKPTSGRPMGFFSPDKFTFGIPLHRSALEAAIQSVPGVCGVEGIRIRRRGWTPWGTWTTLSFTVAANEIVRVQNDPQYPERGSLRLKLVGGA